MTRNKENQYPGRELEVMSFAINYHKWIIEELTPYLGKNVVEVGAGVGNLSTMLLQTSLNHLYAFEPATNLFLLLRQNMEGQDRVSIVNECFQADLVPGVIDSVLYINVLEHIEDDSGELIKANDALRARGHLLLFVPALPWLYSEADKSVGHFRRYYKENLIERVENAGFKIEKVRYFDLVGILPWYVNFVLLKNSFNASNVALYDKLVVPPMRLIEKLLHPLIGKNIVLVARKK